MKRSVIETLLGAVVLLVAGVFLIYGLKQGNNRKSGGYNIFASFSTVGGLNSGDDVAISGVKIGHIESVTLDPKTYLAVVDMNIDPEIKLSTDTAAVISSQSLLGGNIMQLQPGSDDTMMKEGDHIKYSQSPQSLTDLLGKFIFNASNKPAAPAAGSAPPASTASPAATTPAAAPLVAMPGEGAAPAAGGTAHP